MERERYTACPAWIRCANKLLHLPPLTQVFDLGGTLVSRGDISVGNLTSLLLYTVYVGNGLQMLM